MWRDREPSLPPMVLTHSGWLNRREVTPEESEVRWKIDPDELGTVSWVSKGKGLTDSSSMSDTGESGEPIQPDGPPPEDRPVEGEVIRNKVARGVALIAGRGVLVKVIGMVVQLLFARLLAPAAFGEVAFGVAIWMFAVILSDAGMGVGFIRRSEPPTRDEMRALVGLQLAIGILVSASTTLIALAIGHSGWVTAVIVAPLPLLAIRVPAFIRCEREMNYFPMAMAEIVDVLAFSTWALVFAAMGFRVGALATAYFFRVVASLVTFLKLSHGPIVPPSLHFSILRPMMAFGMQFLGVDLLGTVRDLVVNTVAIVVGSSVILGQWTLVQRALQAPLIVISSFWRVSFPAMARFLETDEDLLPVVRRAYSQTLLATAFVCVPLGAAAVPGVAALLGPAWEPAGITLYWQALALFLAGPPYVASLALLYAVGNGSSVVGAMIVEVTVNIGLSVLFVQWWGVAGLGFAGVVAGVVQATQLTIHTASALATRSGQRRWTVLRKLTRIPVTIFLWGAITSTVAMLIVLPMERTIWVAAAAAAGALGAFLLGIALVVPDEFRAIGRLLARLKQTHPQAPAGAEATPAAQ